MVKLDLETRRSRSIDPVKDAGKKVVVAGWVQEQRVIGKIAFIILRDGQGTFQVVVSKNSNLFEMLTKVPRESVIAVKGTVKPSSQARNGYEIVPEQARVCSESAVPLPLGVADKVGVDLDTRMDWRFLDLRKPQNRLIFEIQTVAEHAMRELWVNEGFIEIHSPKLMASPSESGAELFRVDYFGGSAYLAQSPQFYKQMAMSAGFDKVFEIGPVFRANPSFTSRHDTEFTSIDVEISCVDSHHDVMAFEERWIQYFFRRIKDQFEPRIQEFYNTPVVVPTLPFPKIPMEEAYQVLEEQGYKIPKESGGDLDSEAEKVLAKYVIEKFGHDFIFITDYPSTVRPFYHMRYEDRQSMTKSFDLLYRGLEVTSGAQREHRHDILLKQAVEKGLSASGIQFYLNFFKYGCPPHGGFGFGLTRMLMRLLGISNVREVTYLYRGPTRLTP